MKTRVHFLTLKFYLKVWTLCSFMFFIEAKIWSQNEPLSLEQCYSIGLENSPSLRSNLLDIVASDVSIYQSKMAFLPSLNSNLSHGYNWGQSIDPFTNTFATGRTRTNNFAMVSSWEVFTGLMKRYQLQLSETNKLKSEEIFLLNQRNFKNQIAAVYAKLQSDYLVLELYEEQYALVKMLFKNIAAQEAVGRKSPFDKMRIEALMHQDSSAVLSAKNNIKYTEFVLRQLLNQPDSLKFNNHFQLLDEEKMTQRLKLFTDWRVDTLPELKIAQIEKESATLSYKISKAQLLPRLILQSAIGSGYSGRNQELIGTTLVPKPMDVQLRENFYQTAVLTLSIPIFNAYRVKSEVKLAKILIQQTELQIEQIQLDLLNLIERLVVEYENENINRSAKLLVYKTNQELFSSSEKMFTTGVLNYPDYAEAKFAVTQARLDYLLSLSTCYNILLILENLIG